MCASTCVFFQFERLLSGFLLIYISKKRKRKRESDDKTERGAAACWHLHPGSVGSVYSFIFQSFKKIKNKKRRSRPLLVTHKKYIITQDAFAVTPASVCQTQSMQSEASGGGVTEVK